MELMLLKSLFDLLVLSNFQSADGWVDRTCPGLDNGSGNDSLSPMLTGESSFNSAARPTIGGPNDIFEWLLSGGSLLELDLFEVSFLPGLPNYPVLYSERWAPLKF